MSYKSIPISSFFTKINTEDKARDLFWKYRFGDSGFKCPHCGCEKYFALETRPEVRQCKECRIQTRLRAGTILQKSHLSILTWVRAIYLMTTGKRGISALELQRHLGLTRYETALNLTKKIRRALWQRDERYQLRGVVELDGSAFGKRSSSNQEKVLVAVESKNFIDKKGRVKRKAGFAKVFLSKETANSAVTFIKSTVAKGSTLNTDGAKAYLYNELPEHTVNAKVMWGDPKKLDEHLLWVSRFVNNAKAWINGTHHGVHAKYLKYYLAEYTYRFNRRHNVDSLFTRALTACSSASPMTLHAISG